VRRFLAFLYFLMLVNDGRAYGGLYMTAYAHPPFSLWSPTLWVQGVLFDPIGPVRPFDIILLIAMLVGLASRDGKGVRVRPMKSSLLLAAATIAAWFVLGLVRGGDSRAASWQTYLLLVCVLSAFALAANFRTAEQFIVLGKAYLFAAFYRATYCLIFYFGYVRNLSWRDGPPPVMTSHDDSVLWVTAIVLLMVNATELRSRRSVLAAVVGIPVLLLAIQENNRRLAWVSVIGAAIPYIALMRPGRAKSAIKRGLLYLAPVVLAYVVVGWGRPEKIFKPLASFATVSTNEDASTLARNAENLGLIYTANSHGWMLGSGWGFKYICLTDKYSIADAFELWPYIPHNSLLGFLAFLGVVGFTGFWLRVPIAVFLHSRMARLAQTPADRAVGLACVAVVVVCCNQLYGDMGSFSADTQYTLGAIFAAALRLPIESRTWLTARPSALPQAA
jgi:hypothetical protein